MNSNDIIRVLQQMEAAVEKEKDFLTELDNVIGDGDHGINLARGFKEVGTKLPALADKDIATILKTVGMTLVSTVGGASGPLYGTAFLKAAGTAGGKTEVTMNDFLEMLKAAIEGVQMRGKSTAGEKTMLDAMIPALTAMETEFQASRDGKRACSLGVDAAQKGVEYTKTIIATKGRASYLGERSLGHQDPGAASFTLLLTVISESI